MKTATRTCEPSARGAEPAFVIAARSVLNTRVRTLPMPHCITTSRVSAGARSRDSFRMALLPLFRSRTHEVELERRIYALQAALDQCKGVARTWWSMRVRFTVAVALVAMAAGFALGVYRHSIKQAFVDSAVAVGLASPADEAGAPGSPLPRGRSPQARQRSRPPSRARQAPGPTRR